MDASAANGGQVPATKPPVDEPKILTREEVLGAQDLTEETVPVKEWGGAVVIRSFSKGAQIEIRERATVDDEVQQDQLQMIAFLEGVVNPQFTVDDQPALKEKNALAFDTVLKRIFAISGMAATEEEVEAKESQFREGSGPGVPDSASA